MKIYIINVYENDFNNDDYDSGWHDVHLEIGAYLKLDSAINAAKSWLEKELARHSPEDVKGTTDELGIAIKLVRNQGIEFMRNKHGSKEIGLFEMEVNEE